MEETQSQQKEDPFSRYKNLAILINENDTTAPSDSKALECFANAGKDFGLNVEFITKKDEHLIHSFDILFIRETTFSHNHTYHLARLAKELGLKVIDDPDSILRCTNKTYFIDLFRNNNIPAPKSFAANRFNLQSIVRQFTYPLVIKHPESCSSLGVFKVHDHKELLQKANELFSTTNQIVVQEYMPTDFDWRIGVLRGTPLYACKYYMAKNHWQIIDWSNPDTSSGEGNGDTETLLIEEVPEHIIRIATDASRLIGDSFYGVDIKEYNNKPYVIEVNDNPNIDYGIEDIKLGHQLYRNIIRQMVA